MLVARVASVATPTSELDRPSKKARLESDPIILMDCSDEGTSTSHATVEEKPNQTAALSYQNIQAVPSKQSLYMDVMHSILQFLQFDELATASKLNRSWKIAVRTLKPQRNGCVVLGKLPKPSMISWPTAKYRRSAVLPHVTHVGLSAWEDMDPSTQCEMLRPFTRLQVIVGMQIIKRAHLPMFKLPATLTSLSVNVSVWALQKLINACGQLKSLSTLHIRDVTDYHDFLDAQEQAETAELDNEPFDDIPEIDFTPLRRLSLEDLSFQIEGFENDSSTVLVSDLMHEISNNMSSLLRLNLGDITTEEINQLINKPHQLHRLEDIHCSNEYMGPDLLRIVGCHYPTLTDIPGLSKIHNLDDCTLLLKLPGLRQLRMAFHVPLSVSIPPVHQLIDNVRQLQLLEVFELAHPLVTSDVLAELFKHLPLLKSLLLRCCVSLTELTFLNTSPLSKNLQSLSLVSCANLPSIELFQLKALSKLEELHFLSSFNEPLCKFALLYFEPHSPLCIVPTLKQFVYDNYHHLL